MSTLKAAIIGTGNISPEHLKAYMRFPDICSVEYLCDIYTEKCKKLSEGLGFTGAKIVKDYKEILDADIDVVSICLPPSLHCQVAVDFLKHGKNVICEKPMAASLEEADLMIRTAKETGKTLGIISQNRFRTPVMKVKKLIDSGALGRVLFARVNSMWWRGNNYYDLWWRGTWEKEGGGCVLNHSVHQIDMLQYLVGMPETVTAHITNLAHTNSEVEDAGIAIFGYKNMIGELNVSLCDYDEKQEFFFQCEKATVTIPWSVKCRRQLPNGFGEEDAESEKRFNDMYEDLSDLPYETHAGEIHNFLMAVNGKEKLLVTPEEGKKALEIIYAIYKSSIENATVHLPLSEKDAFYRSSTMLKKVPHFYKKGKSVENLEGNITLGNIGDVKK